MDLQFTYTDASVRELTAQALPPLRADLLRTMNRIGFEATRRARLVFRGSGRDLHAGPLRRGGRVVASSNAPANRAWLFSRTGALKRGFGHEVRAGSRPLDITLDSYNSGAIWARSHEKGKRFFPRGALLTVPLDDNLRTRGTSRFPSAAALRERTRSTKERTFLVRSRRGNLVVAYAKTPRARVEFLWVLLRSTTVRPRLGFVKMWRSYYPEARQEIAATIRRALERQHGRGGGRR